MGSCRAAFPSTHLRMTIVEIASALAAELLEERGADVNHSNEKVVKIRAVTQEP